MPTLRQITCAIELGPGNTKLKEYAHKVTDGAVETYIVAPETSDIPFHVRVTSDGYIAPGLAAYVFMDGEYQCNRNRLRLRFPEDGVSTDEYQIDFKLRQKEEKTSAGTFIARDWFFTPLNAGNTDKASQSKDFKDNVGTIEVVILRCKDGGGEELSTDPARTTVSMNPSPAVHTSSRREPSAHQPSARNSSARKSSVHAASATSKKPSMPGSFGGMLGIFDGAGDDQGYYKQYRPKSLIGQEPLPGHRWDASSGKYRYFNDQDPFVNLHDQEDKRFADSYPSERYRPQTYTVAGGFSYQESLPPQTSRAGGPKTFVPQSSPVYDFSTRRRTPSKVSEQPVKQPYDFTRGRKHESGKTVRKQEPEQACQLPSRHGKQTWGKSPRPQPVAEEPLQPGSGIAFVEETAHKTKQLMDHFESEAEKYAALKEDAKRYHDRKGIHIEILKASHRKYSEVLEILGSLGRLYGVLKGTMDAMDRETWRQASDLLYEMQLYPPPAFEVEPPEQFEEREAGVPKKEDDWVQVGGGTHGHKAGSKKSHHGWDMASLTSGQVQKKMSSQKQKRNDTWDDNKSQSSAKGGGGWDDTDDKKSVKGGGGWDKTDDGYPAKGGGGWDDIDDKKTAKGGGGWDEADEKSPAKGGGGWDDTEDKKSAKGGGGWDDTDDKETAKGGGGWDDADDKKSAKGGGEWDDTDDKIPAKVGSGWDDTKSRISVKGGGGWNDNNSKESARGGAGWDDNSKSKTKNNTSWESDRAKEKLHGSQRSRTRHTRATHDGAGSDNCSFGYSQPKPVIKPYWSEWTKKQEMVKPKVQPRQVYEYPASPLPALPGDKQDKGITRAVHAGPGANYAHKLHRPEYLDTMAKPYAIFTFKYRSKAALETILKHKIDDSYISEAEAEAKKHRLLSMPKDELVAELMRKASVAARSRAPSEATTNKSDDDWRAKPPSNAETNKNEDCRAAERRQTGANQTSKAVSNKNDDWGRKSPERRQSSAKPRFSHRESRPNKEWNARSEVKPSDSVSQHSAPSKKVDRWATETKAKSSNSKDNGGAAGWEVSDKGERKKDKSKSRDGGWASEKRSTATPNHWDEDLPTTKPKMKGTW